MDLIFTVIVGLAVWIWFGGRSVSLRSAHDAETLREIEGIRRELHRVATEIDGMIAEREARLAELEAARSERRRAAIRSLLGMKSRSVKRNVTLH